MKLYFLRQIKEKKCVEKEMEDREVEIERKQASGEAVNEYYSEVMRKEDGVEVQEDQMKKFEVEKQNGVQNIRKQKQVTFCGINSILSN